jgi:hypothetical protein
MFSTHILYISLLLPNVSFSQGVVRQWLPMSIGDRWVYQEEARSGSRVHPDVNRRVRQETTVAGEKIPEGTLLRQKVQILDTAAFPVRPRFPDESAILIRGACIFYLSASHHGWGWDPAQHQLTAEFREYVNRGEVLPSACFPLHRGQTWGDPKKGRDLWTVAGVGRKSHDDPLPAGTETWRLEANLASGDDDYVWFRKGIGITAERTYHNGTYDDVRVRLLRFEPAR